MRCGTTSWFIYSLFLVVLIQGRDLSANSSSSKIILGIYESCPYFCWGEKPGYVFELLEQFFRNERISFVKREISLERASYLLIAKEIDIAVFPSYELHVQKDIVPFGPALGVSYAGILHLVSSAPPLWDFSSFENAHIVASPLGFLKKRLKEMIENKIIRNEITQISGKHIEHRLFELVKKKRFDYAIHDYNILRYRLSRLNAHQFHVSPSSLLGFSPLRLATLRGRRDILLLGEKLDSFIAKMRNSLDFEKTLKSYDIEDWYYTTY